MTRLVKAFVAASLVFVVIDFLWIWLVAAPIYDSSLGALLRPSPKAGPAIVFYLGYVAGVLYLAVWPALQVKRFSRAAFNGAVLGALCYGTFALTSYILLAAWTVSLVTLDILWGAALTATTATAGYLAARD